MPVSVVGSEQLDRQRNQLIAELGQPTCRRGEGFADSIAADSDGTIRGRAVPLSKWVQLTPGLMEYYEPGVFGKQMRDPARVKICLEHGQVIGRVTSLSESDSGVHFEGQISASAAIPEAGKARAMLADGLMDELSVGFKTLKDGTDVKHLEGVTTWRHKFGQLLEISLVPWGAMGREATLTRALIMDDFDEHSAEHRAELEARRAAEREWLASFRSRMSR